MTCSILMAYNDSNSSRAALDRLIDITGRPEQSDVTLVHIFRKPTGSEEMMGKKFMRDAPNRIKAALDKARSQLIRSGFRPEHVFTRFIQTPYPTVADGIIDQFEKGSYDLVVLGRRKMSKAEEFVLGDTSIKLVRALEGASVLVIKQ